MSTGFRVSIVNFDPETGQASPSLGETPVGELDRDALIALFERLRAVDPIENVEAEPAVSLESRRQKHVVTTAVGRLYLSDPRNSFDPPLVLTAEEIVAELDGSAAEARKHTLDRRSRSPAPAPDSTERAKTPETVSPGRPVLRRLSLGTLALGFATYAVVGQVNHHRTGSDADFEPIADASQQEAYQRDIAGVYLTGEQPGDHGIALAEDGTMKLFQINAQGAPSLIRGTFRVGRTAGQLAALGNVPGGPMRFNGRSSLSYGGSTYLRIR